MYQVCYTSRHFLERYRSFVYIRVWLISDSHIILWTKLLSYMFSWLKTMDNCLISHGNCLFGRIFAWGAMCRIPSFCRTISGPLGGYQMCPQSQRWTLSFLVWHSPKMGSQMCFYVSVGWELFRGRLSPKIIFMYRILGYTWYLFYTPFITTHMMWCIKWIF